MFDILPCKSVPSEPSVNDIRTSFSHLLHSTSQVEVQNDIVWLLCIGLKCLICLGTVTDHDDTIVRRGARPGVTAVQLRLHPDVPEELSVEKKMSTVLVFVVKIGGRK